MPFPLIPVLAVGGVAAGVGIFLKRRGSSLGTLTGAATDAGANTSTTTVPVPETRAARRRRRAGMAAGVIQGAAGAFSTLFADTRTTTPP